MKYFEECKNCKLIEKGGKRYPGCHDHCEYGVEQKRLRDAEKTRIYEAERGPRMAQAVAVKSIRRMKSGRWSECKRHK